MAVDLFGQLVRPDQHRGGRSGASVHRRADPAGELEYLGSTAALRTKQDPRYFTRSLRHGPPSWHLDALADGHVRADRDRAAGARLITPEGGTAEWKSLALRAYQRRTLAADALIASSYLAGTKLAGAGPAGGLVRGDGRQGQR